MTLQTADRALRLVRLVASRGEMTLTEAAGALQISASMAHRLLRTCAEAGYLDQELRHGPYTIGPALRQITADVARGSTLPGLLGGVLRQVAEGMLETTSLAVLEGRNIRFILTEEGTHLVRIARPVRTVTPAHATAAGRALLAGLTDDDLAARYQGAALETVQPGTIQDWAQLKAEIKKVRNRGWAIQVGEAQPGVAALAMPLRDGFGQTVAAVTVMVPYLRLSRSDDARSLAHRLRPYADQMERRLASGSAR
ncbi:IclR family transcriptional regulator [Citricoccus zhacaiensis]|uniref:IclR family transcriptional regulator n=1 Tax=Citricoccus zhacaiensis TaxID=489142 RepID=A0ABQ2M5N3_9MICC|nr:IclR family transcriptional regulator [Citricoccus zhacaiensis]GGO47215.1 IclR family transcriptional regulator [Citricoccus zhacaiensis]